MHLDPKSESSAQYILTQIRATCTPLNLSFGLQNNNQYIISADLSCWPSHLNTYSGAMCDILSTLLPFCESRSGLLLDILSITTYLTPFFNNPPQSRAV